MAKTNIGTMDCSECGKGVVVKQNENATLSYTCAWCDDANYAKKGTGKNEAWKLRLKPLAPAANDPAPSKQKPAPSGLII